MIFSLVRQPLRFRQHASSKIDLVGRQPAYQRDRNISLVFRCEPGKEDIILKIASAYEAASQRRVPPPAFGPLPI
jgi:hypothetical protein